MRNKIYFRIQFPRNHRNPTTTTTTTISPTTTTTTTVSLTTTTTTTCIGECIDAPAPENITLTPDAVGSNPVTWYWKCMYHRQIDTPVGEFRSSFSTWGSFTMGDDTTKITIGGMNVPWWSNALDFLLSSSPNDIDITHLSYDDSNTYPGETVLIVPFVLWDYANYVEFTLNEPIKQISTYPCSYIPTGIILTPDLVGSSPVIWYYKLVYLEGGLPSLHTTRSLFTEEQSFIIGDSTTEIIVSGADIPFWADVLGIILGTTSGNYPYYTQITLSSEDIFGDYTNLGYGNLEPLILSYFPENNDCVYCEPTTTITTTTQIPD